METSPCSDNAFCGKGVVLEQDEIEVPQRPSLHTWVTSANCRSGCHDEREGLPLTR